MPDLCERCLTEATMNYKIRRITSELAKQYIHANHYSHGSHKNPSPCYGLYDNDCLIGVLMFAVSCSENVCSSVFGKDYKRSVLELHRLHIQDITPRNTESWFISQCLHQLEVDRPEINAVISFSDPTEGHRGTIYQATNALYYGQSSKATFYRDQSGRLHHPRQCGKNISKQEALDMNWIPEKRLGKYRYLWLMGNKANKRYWSKQLKITIQDYPKGLL